MKNAPERQTSPVWRITVDERLTDDLIRVLIAVLKPNKTTFNDDSEHWNEEEEFIMSPDDYQRLVGRTQSGAEQWPWKGLLEGQVFLRGKFRESPEQAGEFAVDTKMEQDNFQRIDYFSKNRVKKVYMNALERSTANDETDRTR